MHGSLEEPLKFQAPALVLEGDDHCRPTARAANLCWAISTTARRDFDRFAGVQTWREHQQRALSLLLSSQTTAAFDVASEPKSVRERYGETINGMSLLLARRLVEAGVPFVTVFWKENEKKLAKKCASAGGWDTHGNNFNCLKEDLLAGVRSRRSPR